jgi:RNA polymerase sigma-54 factor
MHIRTEQRAEQRLALLPAMLESIEVLQLAAHELTEFLDQAAESNETLDVERKQPRQAVADIDGLASSLAAPPPDLRTLLRLQLAWRTVPNELAEKVMAVAEHLDERGLLGVSDAELALAVGGEGLTEAVELLQSLEPRGVGARSGVDAMLMQLDARDPDRVLIERLLREHLDELARNKLPQVARGLGLELDDVQRLLERVKQLNPRPAASIADATPPPEVDLDARLEDGEVVVRLRTGREPELRVSPHYERLASRAEAGLRRYLRPKLQAARSLIRAVGMRRRTLLRVAAAVLGRQVPFLEHGPRAMRALRMSDVAAGLGLHPSTVSRAIAGKWVSTAHGAFALRSFCDAGVPAGGAGAVSGADVGHRAVLERLRELIGAEDAHRPLADDELAALLASEGIEVARRTVAKYRAELGIRSQWQRRAHRVEGRG